MEASFITPFLVITSFPAYLEIDGAEISYETMETAIFIKSKRNSVGHQYRSYQAELRKEPQEIHPKHLHFH